MIDPKSRALSGRSNIATGQRSMQEAIRWEAVPQSWICRATKMPGKTLHLALLIWCAASRNRVRSFSISNVDASSFGLKRNSKYRALQSLEQAGLITVERKLGRSPVVTIIDPRGVQDGKA